MLEIKDSIKFKNLKLLLDQQPDAIFTCHVPFYEDPFERIVVFQICPDNDENLEGLQFKLLRFYNSKDMEDEWVMSLVLKKARVEHCFQIFSDSIFGFQSGFRVIEWSVMLAYKRIVSLLASIWFYGEFESETPNEKELQELMERLGFWPFENEDDLITKIGADIVNNDYNMVEQPGGRFKFITD